MRAIRVSTTGGPEVLEYTEVPTPEPGADDALVRVEAAGVNFIDVYHRTGLYKLATPFTPGSEAAGTVEAVGSNVTSVKRGDRVAYAMTLGAYAEYAVVPVDKPVHVPPGIETRRAAAAPMASISKTQSCTARPDSTSSHPTPRCRPPSWAWCRR